VNFEPNIDAKTVAGFGEEWSHFDQSDWDDAEQRRVFDDYFSCFPLSALSSAEGFDLGCGSGRWAALVAPHVRKLHCIDAADKALTVARRRLAPFKNVELHLGTVDEIPLKDGSQDFGYSLGVLHHIPDTQRALNTCVKKLKPGAPFLLYLYYSFDNRGAAFKAVWKLSDLLRVLISRLPFRVRRTATTAIAALAYLPLARSARFLERRGLDVSKVPLNAYRDRSFYAMKTDALDRFGTRLEQRFSKAEVRAMMEQAGLPDIIFNERPYWTACGTKALLLDPCEAPTEGDS